MSGRPYRSQLGPVPRDPEAGRFQEIGPNGTRLPPPMQVVTKGWWTLREERASADELLKADRHER